MPGPRSTVAAITGAGSGIGRALALALAGRGARLALSDVGEDGLAETARLAGAAGAPEVLTTRVDVTDRETVEAWAAEVVARFGVVHQVFNNAGVAFNLSVLESTWEDYERVLQINLFGVIHGTRAFLPHLIASGDGHVVNISSLNGVMAQARLSAYCASKFAVRGFTESLRIEMLDGRHPVGVTSVHPGGISTNISRAALAQAKGTGRELPPNAEAIARTYDEKLLKMPAEKAAEIIVRGVEKGRSRVMVGTDAKALDGLVRLLPNTFPRIGVALHRRVFSPR